MPDANEKKRPGDKLPRTLPNPSYDYQPQHRGSFVSRYDEKKNDDRKAEREKVPALNNFKLSTI